MLAHFDLTLALDAPDLLLVKVPLVLDQILHFCVELSQPVNFVALLFECLLLFLNFIFCLPQQLTYLLLLAIKCFGALAAAIQLVRELLVLLVQSPLVTEGEL